MLQNFHLFSALSHEERLLILDVVRMKEIKKGRYLFREGETDNKDYLLCEGKLELKCSDGFSRIITGGQKDAAYVLSSLQPRQHTARALSKCTYLKFDASLTANLVKPEAGLSQCTSTGEINFHSCEVPDWRHLYTAQGQDIAQQVYEDLKQGVFTLPSLPETAHKLRQELAQENAAIDRLQQLLEQDPVIGPKLIRIANSPFYRGLEECRSINQALVRLGVKTTRQLVLSLTMRELFVTEEASLIKAMRDVWQETVLTAAVAAVLAKRTGRYPAEEALLAATLCSIGALSVFSYLERHAHIAEDEKLLYAVISELRGELGGLVLEDWGMSEDFVTCGREGHNWDRQRVGDGDLCDLVITASLHALVGKHPVPRIDHVSACSRVLSDQLCPEFAIQFMHSARREINETCSLLSL